MSECKLQIFAILFTSVDSVAYNFDSEITGKSVRYSAQHLTKSKTRRSTFNTLWEKEEDQVCLLMQWCWPYDVKRLR
jgi:hypothetical protein